MPRVRTAPFRRAAPGRVELVSWHRTDGTEPEPLPEALADWDPALAFRARVSMVVDAAGIAADCELTPESLVRAGLLWRSRGGSELRGPGSHIDLACTDGRRNLVLDVDIPGDWIANAVELDVVITTTSMSRPETPLAAARPGAVLWRGSRSVRVEGTGARFPMEWSDFAASPSLPDRAAWFLSWNSDNLHESFAGGVRLYLNRTHPLLSGVADGTVSEDLERLTYEALFFDVGRALLSGALRNEEFVSEPEDYEGDSVGGHIRRSLQLYFPADSVRSLAAQMQTRPGYFDAIVQERLKLFQRFG